MFFTLLLNAQQVETYEYFKPNERNVDINNNLIVSPNFNESKESIGITLIDYKTQKIKNEFGFGLYHSENEFWQNNNLC